jgi:nitroreductase/FMN reductase [NAD(P)H]
LRDALRLRFSEDFTVDPALPGLATLARMANRRVHRRYTDRAVDPGLLRLLCACALSAPSKSDLQQCDILQVTDAGKRAAIADGIPDMPFVRDAPAFLVFLANGRRLTEIARLRGKPFPNDHLDLFFNAVVDTAIVLSAFVTAAEAVGLGACPISVIRDRAAEVSALLELPEHVIPVAGLCLGWPATEGYLSLRLDLANTLHTDRHDEGDLAARIESYDRRRARQFQYKPRDPERWSAVDFYGWSEDKARQYAVPARADFGAFVRAQGFKLD